MKESEEILEPEAPEVTEAKEVRQVVFNLFGHVGYGGPVDEPKITLSSIAEKMARILDENRYSDTILEPTFLISSRGGVADEALRIYSYLAYLPVKITTVAVGLVESAANYVYLAGKHRVCVPSSMFLFHEGHVRTNSHFNDALAGVRGEVRKSKQLIGIVANVTGNRKLATKWHRNTFVLSAEEAKEAGLVHEIKDVLFLKDSAMGTG